MRSAGHMKTKTCRLLRTGSSPKVWNTPEVMPTPLIWRPKCDTVPCFVENRGSRGSTGFGCCSRTEPDYSVSISVYRTRHWSLDADIIFSRCLPRLCPTPFLCGHANASACRVRRCGRIWRVSLLLSSLAPAHLLRVPELFDHM
jgi:hypothetical protein